jgi:hypothetical protein
MKRNKKLILLIVVTVIGLLLASPYPLWQFYVEYKVTNGREHYEKIKNNPKIYCYDALGKSLNFAFYINDLKYQNDLIALYDSAEKGKNIPIVFPIQSMTFNKPLILLRYINKDSSIAEVVDFNIKCWGFIQGYVYKKTLHKQPPTSDLLKKHAEYWKKKEQSIEYQRTKKIVGHDSPYGAHCDDQRFTNKE